MVSDSNGPADGRQDAPAASDASPAGLDEADLYRVVRAAVKDALLDVIGTLLLVGIAVVLVVAGVQIAVRGASSAVAAVGVGLVLAGVYLAAATLELIPPIRDWF